MTMLKRIVIFLALALPFMANAQYGVGDWRIHTIFVGSAAERVIDTPDKVYYLVSNNLFCYDKETEENATTCRMSPSAKYTTTMRKNICWWLMSTLTSTSSSIRAKW